MLSLFIFFVLVFHRLRVLSCWLCTFWSCFGLDALALLALFSTDRFGAGLGYLGIGLENEKSLPGRHIFLRKIFTATCDVTSRSLSNGHQLLKLPSKILGPTMLRMFPQVENYRCDHLWK